MGEVMDRERRSCNLIMYELEEIGDGVAARDSGNDLDKAKAILQSIYPSSGNILSVERIGRKRQNHPRLLKLRLPSKFDALNVLRNKSRYRGPVAVRQDLIEKQRDYLKDLKIRLAELHSSGMKKKTIRYVNGIPRIVDGISSGSKN